MNQTTRGTNSKCQHYLQLCVQGGMDKHYRIRLNKLNYIVLQLFRSVIKLYSRDLPMVVVFGVIFP